MIAGNSAIRRAAIEVPCHDRKLYVAIIIKRPLFTETAAAGVFVTALSISMTSTFCGQSWLRGATRGHVDILSVIRDNFFAEAEYTFLCIWIWETAFMSRQSKVPLLLEVLLTRTLMMAVAVAVEWDHRTQLTLFIFCSSPPTPSLPLHGLH